MITGSIPSASLKIACEISRPSLLPAQVAFREKDVSSETPLEPGAKKDDCFRMLCWREIGRLFCVHVTNSSDKIFF